jgi:hypothetical protein
MSQPKYHQDEPQSCKNEQHILGILLGGTIFSGQPEIKAKCKQRIFCFVTSILVFFPVHFLVAIGVF